MSTRTSRRALSCALFATTALASPAVAQLAPPPPVRQSVDGNGVDLFSGRLFLDAPALSMGQGDPQGFSFRKLNRGNGWTDNFHGGVSISGSTYTVTLGALSDRFTLSNGIYTNTEGNGSTLTYNGTTKIYTYTRPDGTVVRYDKNKPMSGFDAITMDVTEPSGRKLTFNYEGTTYCSSYKAGGGGYICMQTAMLYRGASVRSNFGYSLSYLYNYEYMYDPTAPESQPDFTAWSNVVGVSMTNLAVASGASTRSQTFGEVLSGGSSYFQVTDPMGRVTKYRYGTGGTLGVTLPGSTSEDVTIAYANNRVSTITTPAGITSYSVGDLNGVRTVTVNGPLAGTGDTTTYKFNIASQRLTDVIDANGKATSAMYDSSGRLTRVTQPEGNYVEVTYDARGNVAQRSQVAKSASGLADIIETAGYDATCSNPKICNQPNWTKDARGNQTDYTYDPNHGGVLTVTGPAPSAGAIRPQVRYSYSSLQAYFRDANGNIVASGQPVTLLTGTSTCQTGSSCAGTADEVKKTISYGPQTAGVGNNLLPVSVSKGAGDNSLTATTAFTYDDVGNLTYTDGPLAGTADTTRALYNANRELVGTISADPDGAGTLKNRAQRITIDSRGLTTKVENGTTAGQSDSAWAAFSAVQAMDVTYDARRRQATQRLSSGATNYALTQTSYYPDDSVECVAQRMNPAAFNSLPASACTLGTQGSFGPDRITKTIYDNEGQLTQVQVALGTADAANERTLTYTNNGMLATLKDAENNLTTFEYDGHDRLSKTRFPVTTKGASSSSTTDYEQLTYDINSNVTVRRDRGGALFNYSYDNLNRLTVKVVPDEPWLDPSRSRDVYYSYDLLGRMTAARFDSAAGEGISNTYDALGRLATSTTAMDGVSRSFTSTYDAAGNRTALTGHAGYSAGFTYDVLGRMTSYMEGQVTPAVRFGYDDLGRRTSLGFGAGGITSKVVYGYDPVSRLSSLTHDVAGDANDLTQTFTYNPASQITTVTRSNDQFAFTGHGSGSTSSTANGLNQLTTLGAATLSHDPRGNLTSNGTHSYVYDMENRLVWADGPTATGLFYDPLGRLWRTQDHATAAYRYYIYNGSNELVAEYDGSGNVLRSHVHGPGADEPLVTYEMLPSWTRRFLHADERGSIVALADNSGNLLTGNRYDEFGRPATSNQGRFQYTGQMWLPEVGLYHYKARAYDPRLGRFLQTDPIGYGDGMNLYAYVGNDAVNFTDPSGLSLLAKWMWRCYGSCQVDTASGGYWNTGTEGLQTPADREAIAVSEQWWLGNTPITRAQAEELIRNRGGFWDGPRGNARYVSAAEWFGYASFAPQVPGFTLAQFTPPEALPNPANDRTAAEGCERASRTCAAKSRMIPDPHVSQEYLKACLWLGNACMERALDPTLRTNVFITFPDGTSVIILPGGRVQYISPYQSRPR